MQGDQKISDQNIKGVRGDEYKKIQCTMRVRKSHMKLVEETV